MSKQRQHEVLKAMNLLAKVTNNDYEHWTLVIPDDAEDDELRRTSIPSTTLWPASWTTGTSTPSMADCTLARPSTPNLISPSADTLTTMTKSKQNFTLDFRNKSLYNIIVERASK